MSPPWIQSPRTIPSGRGSWTPPSPLRVRRRAWRPAEGETAWRIGPVQGGTENPEDEMSSGCAAAVPSRGRPGIAAARPAFSHPDFTVGSGVAPDPAPPLAPCKGRSARGLYRRSGIGLLALTLPRRLVLRIIPSSTLDRVQGLISGWRCIHERRPTVDPLAKCRSRDGARGTFPQARSQVSAAGTGPLRIALRLALPSRRRGRQDRRGVEGWASFPPPTTRLEFNRGRRHGEIVRRAVPQRSDTDDRMEPELKSTGSRSPLSLPEMISGTLRCPQNDRRPLQGAKGGIAR
jgi:hypothetical protein